MGVVVNDGYSNEKEIQLTVNGNSGGSLFRIHRGRREILLTDSHNKSLLALRRKWNLINFEQKLSLRQRWEGYAGTGQEGSKRIFSVRRSLMIGWSDWTAEVYGNPMVGKFRIKRTSEKGRFDVYDTVNRSAVGEIRREEDKFILRAMPGSDCAFGVALAVVLEQIGDGTSP